MTYTDRDRWEFAMGRVRGAVNDMMNGGLYDASDLARVAEYAVIADALSVAILNSRDDSGGAPG